MTSTFYLKSPNSETETLILFSCYFKQEGKKFVYSTGEKIKPKEWDQNFRRPISRGKNKCKFANSINGQLGRYSRFFEKLQARCKLMEEDFTSRILKKEFDQEFKKAPTGKNIFFDAYDQFTDEKTKNLEWSHSTVKRYKNIKNILVGFQRDKKFKLSFNSINNRFHAEFTDYCMNTKKHVNNTYARNLGLFKTFMFWALENNFTYNEEFKKFKKKPRVITSQVTLEKKDLVQLLHHKYKSKSHERIRDVFVFACVTGMRFGELKLISKNNIYENSFHLKEEKDSDKEVRTIPLSDIARFILNKYDYSLPLIANQKHNEYIKTVFKLAGFNHKVEKVSTRGKEVIRKTMFFYDRVSTHTARRTFITMMKREGKSDKLIGKITGHTDMKTLNTYYQVEDDEKKEAIDQVFNLEIPLLKKA